MIIETMTMIAIVTQDQAALRAAPKANATQQVVLWQGDNLEVRGQKQDYLQVYDHRRERAGFIKASQVKLVSLKPADAAESLAVVRYLRDTPKQEALGIAYTAAYLKAAPAGDIKVEAFDALGTMADRLARRASNTKPSNKPSDKVLPAHLEVAAGYGVKMQNFERDGQVQLCYDGEAFRHVLAMNPSPEQAARAALGLTQQACISPDMPPLQRAALDEWRAQVLEKVDISKLPDFVKNRIQARRASVWSSIAYQRARRNPQDNNAVKLAAQNALSALASVNKLELAEQDATDYTDAALRVGASRWAAETVLANANNAKLNKGLSLISSAGQAGETCLTLIDNKHDEKNPLLKNCTYGIVWQQSARSNALGTALTLAVQPLDSWRELWVFHQTKQGWQLDIMPPNNTNTELGYIEFAGWVPGKNKMLAARETKLDGRYKRSFELINLETMAVEKWADSPNSLSTFYRWQDPLWKQQTVSVR